jgi:hypothetical protein
MLPFHFFIFPVIYAIVAAFAWMAIALTFDSPIAGWVGGIIIFAALIYATA